MPKQFEPDEFDRAPEHGGRHRIRRTGSTRVREWFMVFAVSALVTVVGFFGFKIIGDSNTFRAIVPTDKVAEPQVPGTIGPGVTVIDATSANDLASGAAAKLLEAGFNVLTARNLDTLRNPGSASISAVYIKAGTDSNTANQVAAKLGGLKVVTADKFDDPITVVLGTSYKQ
jgi:hypothetical protein